MKKGYSIFLITILLFISPIFSLQAQNTDPSYKLAGAAMRNSSAVQDDYMQVLSCYDTTLLNVLANDDIINQCSINNIVLHVTGGSGIAVIVNGDKNIVYLPAAGFIGHDTLEYEVYCYGVLYGIAKVFITVVECPDNITVVSCSGAPPATEWGIKELARSSHYVLMSAQLLVGDVDGCGKNEIVTFAESNQGGVMADDMLIFDDKLNLKASINIGNSRVFPTSPLAIADVDGCGKAEIFVLTGNGYTTRILKCFWYNGVSYVEKPGFNQISTPLTMYENPTLVIGDINGDGVPELLIYNSIYNAQTGNLIATLPIGGSIGSSIMGTGNIVAMPVLADVDNDGILEIVCGNMVYKAYINEGSTALITPITIAYQAPTGEDVKDGLVSVADIDLDGYLDVVVTYNTHAQGDNIAYVWSPYKGIMIEQPFIVSSYTSPWSEMVYRAFIGDVDNDGYPDIVFSYTTGIVCYKYYPNNPLGNRFEELWRHPVPAASLMGGISMFDFNQDGKPEIIFRDGSNLCIKDGETGENITTIESCNSLMNISVPVVVDFTGEGFAQIVTAGSDIENPWSTPTQTIRLYGSSVPGTWAPARKVWNQLGYNSININEDLTVPRFQMNPATVFPGPDGILGTADDIRPFNNFLQQQTLINQNGIPFFTMPNIVWIAQPAMTINDNTAVFEGCIKNIGDAALQAPIFFTYYKNDTIPANIIALDSIQNSLAAGDTLCFTYSIDNWNTYEPVDVVWISVNDRNGVYPYQAQCVTDGRRIAMDEDTLNYAAFYANNVHHDTLYKTTFCAKEVHFQAEIEGDLHPDSGRIKWFIDGNEHLAVRDSLEWNWSFETGGYKIELQVRFADDIVFKRGFLKMEILWIKMRNVRY